MGTKLILFVMMLAPATAYCQSICGPQSYDVEVPPDFTCPGPDEAALVPDLNPPGSIPVQIGWKLVSPQSSRTLEWEGAVVHRDRLIEMGLKLQAVRRLRWSDRLRLKAEYDIRLGHAADLHSAETKSLETRIETYEERLAESERNVASEQAWYRSFGFGVLVGVVGTAALVAVAAWALSSID